MTASKREKDLARQRAERQAARKAAASARTRQRRAVLASVLAVLLVAVGVGALAASLAGGEDEAIAPAAAPSSSTAASTPASANPAAAGTCAYDKSGEASRKVELPPTTGVETRQPFVATLATNVGNISFELLTAKAPCTVNSFRSLAHFQFFDDTPCHRLTTGGIFVLQCGDPTGSGSGGPGYQFAEENLEGATYPRGTVAGAKTAAPGTTGSQFFLVYKDSPLPPQYTPFGRITAGLDVLDKIAAAGSEPEGDGKPKTEVTITTARVKAKA
ncbi:MAG: peptidyl-prolyl cis-trans isomerase cyclophilin type [Frankiales bacterium]|nr:peptidyl-prolyl cis-trans isomerase cyclophilin type [Frankiales bacterium]